MQCIEATALFYRDGSSDKVYQAQVVEWDDGCLVNFQYGRRGSTLATGTKTKSPVTKDEALKIYEKIIREKKAKGYTEGEGATPYAGGDKAERVTGLSVQLLNPITENEVQNLLADPNYVLQEKLDGKRMILKYHCAEDVTAVAINRSGLTCGAPQSVLDKLSCMAEDNGLEEFVLDGECIGDRFFAFDILNCAMNLRHLGYADRRRYAGGLGFGGAILWVPIFAAFEKEPAFKAMKEANKEGVVFKHKGAPYTPGRPNSGGTQFKFKFKASATVHVEGINSDRRSVRIYMAGDEMMESVGNVTIPPNHEVPAVGQCVEVEYLYAYRNGSLYQPVYKGVRDDKTLPDQIQSLKFKAEAENLAA